MEDVALSEGDGNQPTLAETAKQDPTLEHASRHPKEFEPMITAEEPSETRPQEDLAKPSTKTEAKRREVKESIDRLERARARARACLFGSDGNMIAAREPRKPKHEENETRPGMEMEAQGPGLGDDFDEWLERAKERNMAFRKRFCGETDLPGDLDSIAPTDSGEKNVESTVKDETMGGLEEGKDLKRKGTDSASVDRTEAVEGAVYRMKESEGRKRGRVV